MKRERERVSISFPGAGRVKQQFREESDVNVIMARWRKTGILPSGNAKEPMYGDFSNADDFMEARNKVMAATDAFKALPAKIRARFNHEPAELLDFMADPGNEAEAIEMGVIPGPEPERQAEPEVEAESDP